MRLLIIFTLLAMVKYASADVGYYINKGQPPGPAEDAGEPDVRMAAEAVDIILHPDGVDVKGIFEFVNDSDEPRDVGMFYPLNVGTLELTDEARKKLKDGDLYGFELEGTDVTARFSLGVNGEEADYEIKHVYYDSDGYAEELTGSAVWTTMFAPGEKKTVMVLYHCSYGTQGAPAGNGEFYYVLYTGAPWKGSIGEGRITIKPGPGFDWKQPILPRTMDMPPLAVYDDRLEWTFKDFEPSAPDTEKGVKHGIWNGSAIEIVVPRGKEALPDSMKSGYEGPTGTTSDSTVALLNAHPYGAAKPRFIADVPLNAKLTLLERYRDWYYVNYSEMAPDEGIKGWLRWHEYNEKTKEEQFNIVEISVY